MALAGTGTGAGNLRVTTGILQLTGSLATTANLILGHNTTGTSLGKFILGSSGGAVNQTIASLQTSGGAQASQSIVGGHSTVSTLTVNQSTNTTYAGILGGAGENENHLALTKLGAGTLTLTGSAHTHTGSTTINGGKLILHGSLAGSLTTTTGTFAPQATPSIAGNLEISSGGNLEAAHDVILAAAGNVTLAGNLDLIAPTGLSVGASFTLVNKTSPGAITGTFAGKPEGAVFTAASQNWQITYAGGDGNDVVVTLVQPLTAADLWRQLHFGTTENTGNAADSADPNNDGETNLIEFATGQNPHAATRATTTLALPPGTNLEFTYTRSKAAFDGGYGFDIQYSDTLAATSWTSVGPGNLTTDGPQQTVTATIPEGAAGKRFVRLQITTP